MVSRFGSGQPITSTFNILRAGGEDNIFLTLASSKRFWTRDAIQSLDTSDLPPTEVPGTAGFVVEPQ